MTTKDALGAGFKPSEAAIDAGSLDWGQAYAFHHAIHQLWATKMPNKRRLPTAKSAHLNPLRAGLLKNRSHYLKLYLSGAHTPPDEVSRPMRPTEALLIAVLGLKPNKRSKMTFNVGAMKRTRAWRVGSAQQIDLSQKKCVANATRTRKCGLMPIFVCVASH